MPAYPAPGQQAYVSAAAYGARHQAYPATGYQYQAGKDPSLAEWWRRLLARIIDAIVGGALSSPFWIPPFATYVSRVRNIDQQDLGSLNSPAAQNPITHAGSKLVG